MILAQYNNLVAQKHILHALHTRVVLKQNNKVELLRRWYLNYIDCFREECKKLSPDEKKGISHMNEFRDPCQIEIFWITDPQYQLIVQSNCKDRSDKEIIIHGPHQPYEFHSNALATLVEKRWSRSIAPDSGIIYEHADTLGEAMATEIYKIVEIIKHSLFQPQYPTGYSLMAMLVGDVWASVYPGNISDLDYVQETRKTIQEIRRDAKTRQEQQLLGQQPKPFTNYKYAGFGTHFYPPITMNKESKPTIEQLIYNTSNAPTYRSKAFDTKISGHQVIVNNDGLVFIETKCKEHALKILNLIMACGVFYGHHFYAVHERELVMANYDQQSLELTSMQWNTGTRRALLLHGRYNPRSIDLQKTYVEPETIREILSNAEKLLTLEELATDMRLLNEGLTHFANSEFDQSFIMGWTVIERQCFELWRAYFDSKNVASKDFPVLANRKRLSVHLVLESLALQNIIDKDLYDRVQLLRNTRNRFYHCGQSVTRDKAEDCLNCSITLTFDKIRSQISISNNLILHGKQSIIKIEDLWQR